MFLNFSYYLLASGFRQYHEVLCASRDRASIKILKQQLGFGMEPTLCKGHELHKELEHAIDEIKNDGNLQRLTRKPLHNDPSFQQRCTGLFQRYGERIWDGSWESGATYSEECPQPLNYKVPRDEKKYVAKASFKEPR